MGLLSGGALGHLLEVLGVNLVLSGDNAVVIAMAVRGLRGSSRRAAVAWGAVGAVVLRLLFAAVIASLLRVPLLQLVGGVLLVWIAWQLVRDAETEVELPRRGTMRLAIGQQEAKDRGFLEEALARPGG